MWLNIARTVGPCKTGWVWRITVLEGRYRMHDMTWSHWKLGHSTKQLCLEEEDLWLEENAILRTPSEPINTETSRDKCRGEQTLAQQLLVSLIVPFGSRCRHHNGVCLKKKIQSDAHKCFTLSVVLLRPQTSAGSNFTVLEVSLYTYVFMYSFYDPVKDEGYIWISILYLCSPSQLCI